MTYIRIENLERKLLESQAREKVLRDALEYILPDTPDQCRVKNNALFLPDEYIALKAALAAERLKERNRIADWYDNGGWAIRDSGLSDFIRALGDEE